MNANNYEGTEIKKGKGASEYEDVDELIKETLAETKTKESKATPTPKPVEPPTPKETELKGTKFTLKVEKPAEGAEKIAPQYAATFTEYKVGDIVKGKVVKVDASGVLVDIRYKADGLILPEELSDKSFASPSDVVKVGDEIYVYIQELENKEGYVVLSKKHADQEMRWKIAYDAFKNHTVLEGTVLQVLKGGLSIDCNGLRGFIPASQVYKKGELSLEAFKGKTLPVKVIEINRHQGKVVFSHRQAASETEKAQSQKLLEELEVGQVRQGIVTNLTKFGAFVDLGGIEGLIHLSELSWKRVKHPSEVLKSGQKIDVFILGIDKVNKKVSLGLKELQPDPWAEVESHYQPGQIVKAKIVRFARFGAFAELEYGLEGLIHISELSKEPVQKPENAVKIGDIVEVKILRILPQEQRIGLSIKEVIQDREKNAYKQPSGLSEKVTIGDILAQKEKEQAEREAEFEEEPKELPPPETPTIE